MQKKHYSRFDDYTWYVKNDITNPSKVIIPNYYERVYEIFDIAILLSSDRKKRIEFYNADHTKINIFFEVDTINKSIIYGMTLTIREDIYDKYHY